MSQPKKAVEVQRVIHYKAETRELDVELTDGSLYRYPGVPFQVFAIVLAATDPEESVHRHLKTMFKGGRLAQATEER